LVFFRGFLETAGNEAAVVGIVGHELSHLDRGHHLWRIPREIYQGMTQDPLGVTHADYDRGAPRRGGNALPFEPRVLNFTVREMLEATGNCIILLGTTFFRAHRQNDRITAIEAWFPGKRLQIEADVFIDSTADGDVCVDAGCEYHMGEDPKSLYSEPSAPEKAEMSLNEHDCLAGVKNQKHPDIIAITDHAVDLHGRKGRLYEVPNGPYGVPYRTAGHHRRVAQRDRQWKTERTLLSQRLTGQVASCPGITTCSLWLLPRNGSTATRSR
jgi:hypothetical protein